MWAGLVHLAVLLYYFIKTIKTMLIKKKKSHTRAENRKKIFETISFLVIFKLCYEILEMHVFFFRLEMCE